MDLQTVLQTLKSLGTQQTKKTYINHGAKEPLFGVTTGAMKPLIKEIKQNYELSMALFDTGNYDAVYLAGLIADPQKMTREDFEKWMKGAYCPMISEYVVAVSLAGTDFAAEVSDRWIASGREPYLSAGWSCYSYLLQVKPDSFFDRNRLEDMLRQAEQTIHIQPNRTKYAMNSFVAAVGISYLPLYEQALKAAEKIGPVEVDMGPTNCKTPIALKAIQKAAEKGKLGYKRKNLRC